MPDVNLPLVAGTPPHRRAHPDHGSSSDRISGAGKAAPHLDSVERPPYRRAG